MYIYIFNLFQPLFLHNILLLIVLYVEILHYKTGLNVQFLFNRVAVTNFKVVSKALLKVTVKWILTAES